MCLTIPKKVISVENNLVTVELPDGTRQEVKSIVELKPGDFCLTQQNVAIEKVDEENIKEIFDILKGKINESKNENNGKGARSS
jgi:hydrogenase maturation factor